IEHTFTSFFFFQAEDGIRDWSVTGVQTCALPISREYSLRSFTTSAHHIATAKSSETTWARNECSVNERSEYSRGANSISTAATAKSVCGRGEPSVPPSPPRLPGARDGSEARARRVAVALRDSIRIAIRKTKPAWSAPVRARTGYAAWKPPVRVHAPARTASRWKPGV